MKRFAMLLLLASGVLADDGSIESTISEYAQFCEGQYALCIKAPCQPIVTKNDDGSFTIDDANCTCDVVTGWSMGPAPCDDREPVTDNGRTFLMSTYSNFFNKTNLTLTCSSDETVWAWCYGAPCSIDPKDPSKAICTCPVQTGPAKTLGGACRSDACSSIWSAASFAEDWFANNYFAAYMKKEKLQPPANPAAQDCPASGQ